MRRAAQAWRPFRTARRRAPCTGIAAQAAGRTAALAQAVASEVATALAPALAAALAVALCGAAGIAQADFVDPQVGARALSMGGAFVAVTGDPASLFWNPAAIIAPQRVQLSGMRTSVYDGVDGLSEDFLGATFQARKGLAVGAGWSRTGLKDVYHEDLLTAAAALALLRGRLVVGGSVLFYGVAAPGYEALNDPNYLGAQWKLSFSTGVVVHVLDNFDLGASAENLVRPEIRLISTTARATQIGGRRRLGATYLLQKVVRISGELRHNDIPEYVDQAWTLHVGAESWFNNVVAVRAGVDDGALTAGAGLLVKKVRTDVGLMTHERLGNTYRATITIGF